MKNSLRFVFIAVFREGIETVLFLGSIATDEKIYTDALFPCGPISHSTHGFR